MESKELMLKERSESSNLGTKSQQSVLSRQVVDLRVVLEKFLKISTL